MKKIVVVIGILLVVILITFYVSLSETEDTFRTCQILAMGDVDSIDFREHDSVTVAASTLYEASFLKQLVQGEQYRKAWSEPVTVPIAFLDTLKGGLIVIEEGGGQQTHSLELEDKKGIRYALRSLSKDPDKLIPDVAKQLGIENIVVDGISAQHPYAALVVAKLAEMAKIPHTNPQLLFVPVQERLGSFNEKFGNRLYLFEYESEGKVDWTGITDVSEIIDTEELQELRAEIGASVRIDMDALIRARLFDFVIGDWDRHAKQWGWALKKAGDDLIAIPIPADRDNAFFHIEGILPNIIANDMTYPEIQSFEENVDNLQGLVRPFDEYFLRTAQPQQFLRQAEELQFLLKNEDIDAAFSSWPVGIEQLNGAEVREKVSARLKDLPKYAKRFHEIITERPYKEIKLRGSKKLELDAPMSHCFDCVIN